jgi:hypothetical protein
MSLELVRRYGASRHFRAPGEAAVHVALVLQVDRAALMWGEGAVVRLAGADAGLDGEDEEQDQRANREQCDDGRSGSPE